MGNIVKRIEGVWFSPTGTTRRVVEVAAEAAGKALGCEVGRRSINLPEDRSSHPVYRGTDLVILGVPVYAGRVPNVLLDYLRGIEGNGALGVPVVLYGNRDYDDALIELGDIMREGGFTLLGGGAFIGEHSFSRTLAAGRPDADDIGAVREFGGSLAGKILEERYSIEVVLRGKRPYRSYYRPKDVEGRYYDFRKIKPVTGSSCTHCKICAGLCPMGSIDSEKISEFRGICIKCGACIKGCPQEARYYNDRNYLKHKHELEDEFKKRRKPEIFL